MLNFFKEKEKRICLKTHTVYPEYIINEAGKTVNVKMINVRGDVIKSVELMGESRSDLKQKAVKWINHVAKEFER